MTATVTSSIRQQLDQHRDRAIARWREMARGLALNDTQPKPSDVLSVAAALDIVEPGPMLDADAAAYREHLQYDRTAQFCREDTAAKLAAFGTMEKAQAALRAAEAEVKRLREAIADIDNGSEGFWLSNCSRIERENPRLFGEWPRPRPPLAEMETYE